jgi:hypothetical protein
MSNKRSPIKHVLLDTLIEDYALSNDAGAARFIGVLPAAVCKYRAGMPLSDTTRVKILRKTNWPIAKLDKLAPPRA